MDALQAISQRHGVLSYCRTPVSRDILERTIAAAAAAPSPANTQPWEYVLVDDPAAAQAVAAILLRVQRDSVLRCLLGAPDAFVQHLMKLYQGFDRAPAFIVLCRHRRLNLGSDAFSSVVRDWELCSLGAAMANLMIAATALGLGTRWFGNPLLDPVALHELLGIPTEIEIVAATPIGYHSEPSKQRTRQHLHVHYGFKRGDKHRLAALLDGRLALDDIVHYNVYQRRSEAPHD